MGKLAFFIDPETGSLKQFDHASWNTLVEEAPPDWSGYACPAMFVYTSKIFLRYQTTQEQRVIEVVDLKEYGAIEKIENNGESLSNIVYLRGKVMWLGRRRGTMASYLYTFDGKIRSRMIVTNAAAAETDLLHPAICGSLFCYDSGLFYAPRGLIDNGIVHNHLFKIDPDTGRCVVLEARLNPTQEYDLTNPWPEKQLGRTLGFSRGVLTAGAYQGDLFVLNADGTLDRLTRGSYERTRCLDLRSAPGMLAGQTVYNMGGKDSNIQFMSAGMMASDGGMTAPFLGGRADLVQGPGRGQSGTIAAMSVNPKNGYTNIGLLSADGVPNVPAFNAGTKVDVRYGLAGALSTQKFIPASAQILNYSDYLIVVTGVGGAKNNDRHAPLMVTRWKPDEDPKYLYITDHGAQAKVACLDCFVDEEGGMLHILWTDTVHDVVLHSLVDLKNMVQRGIHEAGDGHVSSGCLFNYTPDEPFVSLGTPEYMPAGQVTLIPFTLWATGKDLNAVEAVVEYDIGKGWQKAFGPTKMTRLAATKNGNNYVFEHMVVANLNDYVGPVQYRIRASIK